VVVGKFLSFFFFFFFEENNYLTKIMIISIENKITKEGGEESNKHPNAVIIVR
jgi:hypothetical protein